MFIDYKLETRFFDVLLTVHLSIFILVCYYTACGIITPIGGRPVHRLREITPIGGRPVHRLREDSRNLCTGRPPMGVMIPEAV